MATNTQIHACRAVVLKDLQKFLKERGVEMGYSDNIGPSLYDKADDPESGDSEKCVIEIINTTLLIYNEVASAKDRVATGPNLFEDLKRTVVSSKHIPVADPQYREKVFEWVTRERDGDT